MKRALILTTWLSALVLLAGCDSGETMTLKQSVARVDKSLVGIRAGKNVVQGGQKRTVYGIGSGTIITDEGHVLTNFHVAGEAVDVKCILYNKERVKATVVGADPWTDLAVLKIDLDEARRKGARIIPATLGDSDAVEVGDPVIAMGTPHGLSRTVTAGIISNNERYLSTGMRLPGGQETGHFNTWLQTDAAINPGNSGGPLVDMAGRVIGVNSRGATGANNIGFAVPVNIARQVVDHILDDGEVKRSWIGIHLTPIVDLEERFKLLPGEGVLINSVDEDSPADEAGLLAEDVLLSIDGVTVSARFAEELPAVRKKIADLPIGRRVRLDIKRAGQARLVLVTTRKLGSSVAADVEFAEWGFTAKDITDRMARDRKLDDDTGILVTGVREGSAAAKTLKTGDVIREMDRVDIVDMTVFREVYQRLVDQKPERVFLRVQRGQARQLLVLRPAGDATD